MSPERLAGSIEKRMGRVKTYQVKMEMEIISPEASRVYILEQWYQSPDRYRLELTGGEARQVIIGSGEDTWIYHPELKDYYKISSSQEEGSHNPYLLSGFWENLIHARELNITGEESHDGKNFYILEVTPGAQTAQWYREKIWLEKKKLVPFIIEVYDDSESLRTVFRYKEISLNEEIDPELFKTDFPWEEASPKCEALSLTLKEARDAVEFPLQVPSYLPSGAEMHLITLAQEPHHQAIIFHYRGSPSGQFSLIQQGEGLEPAASDAANGVNAAGAKKIPLREKYGFIREDDSGINTLFWYTGGKKYIITGELEREQMVKVASSL